MAKQRSWRCLLMYIWARSGERVVIKKDVAFGMVQFLLFKVLVACKDCSDCGSRDWPRHSKKKQ